MLCNSLPSRVAVVAERTPDTSGVLACNLRAPDTHQGLELDALVDLLAMDVDFLGCVDSESDLIAPHAKYRHLDAVADFDGLIDRSGQDQHGPIHWKQASRRRPPRVGGRLTEAADRS